MTKKDPQKDSLRYLETPTAAFPIGSLGLSRDGGDDEVDEKTALRNLVDDLDKTEPRPRKARRGPKSDDELDTEVIVRPRIQLLDDDRADRRVHPVLLALSLLGGGILAVGVVAIFGMWFLYVN
ncbi:MAG: hypothetical protein AAGA48_33930 [Myxococcota bacterium]